LRSHNFFVFIMQVELDCYMCRISACNGFNYSAKHAEIKL